MNEEHILTSLSSLRRLEPREDVMATLKKRVFDAIPQKSLATATISPIQPTQMLSPFRMSIFVSGCVSFALVLVLANQIPMRGSYQDSLNAVVGMKTAFETLDDSSTPEAISQMRAATQNARETLDTLKLKGQFATYTQDQCLQAYSIYDGYLDYVADSLDTKIATTKDAATLSQLKELRAYIADSLEEADKRIHMYPPQK